MRESDQAMDDTTLTEALEREHREIDAGLEAFLGQAGEGGTEDLGRASAALRRHIYLEEQFLFPPLRAAGLLAPVLVMLREHGDIWRTLDDLEHQVALQDGSAASSHCRALLAMLEAHNAKEEPIIYPEGDARLSPEAKQELQDFLEGGRMPDGWVCAMAQPRGA
ncbi:MAG TPA: hemerythrin domain-containing protein [Ornithinicoccus sp.]|nr:hemerythrin domain-containing protein [Ornithinicoccus sp.]